MDNQEQRDYAEEHYNRDHCPVCDYSPCIGPKECPEGKWQKPSALPPRSGETVEVDFPEFKRYPGELYN